MSNIVLYIKDRDDRLKPERVMKQASQHSRSLTRSLEDYLEAILFIVRKGQVARVRDIAHMLNVGMPSVTTALKHLAQRGLVNYEAYQLATLTDQGRSVAEGVSRRHYLLRRFLTDVLKMDGQAADVNACRMEHAVDELVLERLEDFMDFIRNCPLTARGWLDHFSEGCDRGQDPAACDRCITQSHNSTAPGHDRPGADDV